jgi:hypothetical protein
MRLLTGTKIAFRIMGWNYHDDNVAEVTFPVGLHVERLGATKSLLIIVR